MYISSVATPPTVRAEWAFKIFDSDGDQLLGENDIRFSPRSTIFSWWWLQHSGAWSMRSPGQTRLLTKALTTRRATRWSGTSSSEQKPILSIAKRKTCLGLSWEKNLRTVSSRLLQGNRPQPNWTDFPCRVQANGGQVVKALQTNCLVPVLQSWNVPCLEKPDPDPITNPGRLTSSTTSESGSKCLEYQIANTYQIINTWMNDKCYQISFILMPLIYFNSESPEIARATAKRSLFKNSKKNSGENWRQWRWGWYYWSRKAGKEWNTWRRKTIMIQMASPVKGCQV